VATNLTIKSENQNTALNSLTERQHDPLNMASRQDSNPKLFWMLFTYKNTFLCYSWL